MIAKENLSAATYTDDGYTLRSYGDITTEIYKECPTDLARCLNDPENLKFCVRYDDEGIHMDFTQWRDNIPESMEASQLTIDAVAKHMDRLGDEILDGIFKSFAYLEITLEDINSTLTISTDQMRKLADEVQSQQ